MPDTIESVLGHAPLEIFAPTTPEELREQMLRAASTQTPVTPWGGGTKQDYGYVSGKPTQVFKTSGLDTIVSHEPDDMIVIVEAGVTLAKLQATLATKGQFLPLDPLDPNAATMGGILATNAFGLSALGYGTARDWLIGIKIIDASGEWVKGGGKVVKNVTGYDLPKLHIGALGTLGIITEAIFKVAPLPETEHTLLVRIDLEEFVEGETTLLSTVLEGIRAQTQPVRAILHSDKDGHYLVIGYAGARESVAYQTERAVNIVKNHLPDSPIGSFPEKLERQELSSPSGSLFAVRLQGLPAQSLAQHQLVCYETREVPGYVDTSLGGITEVFWEEANPDIIAAGERLRDIAGRTRASFTILHAPKSYRLFHDVWSPLPSALPLMRRMKEQLDPHHLLNPGRFVGRL